MLGQSDWDSLASSADADGDAQVSMLEFKTMFAAMLEGAGKGEGDGKHAAKTGKGRKGKGNGAEL